MKAFKLESEFTFYSQVISHSYYCIFYSAKAILIKEGIKTFAPKVHKKTLVAFEKYLVDTGKLDFELLKMYKKIIIRAEGLLDIFSKEKLKRGRFTYQKLPQANLEPAKESLDGEHNITSEHVKNNKNVRGLLVNSGIIPEKLPAEEDIKKVEKKLKQSDKNIIGSKK